MSMTFTKLFSSITESTIWTEDAPTRIMWITMLAMADRHGRVWASIPGLANRARVTVPEAETALSKFLSPDKYSRTPDHEGRRIEPIDGGWRLLNHEKYRAIRDAESIKESKRKYINARREHERTVGVENVDRGRHNAEADTEAEAVKILASSAKIALSADGVWENISKEMRSTWERAYPAVNLDNEIAKAAAWILANPKNTKKNYARFLTNWLSRAQDGAPRAQSRESAVDRVRRANAD